MKKILFAIACLIGLAVSASAETYVLQMSDAVAVTGQESVWTCEGFTIVADVNGGTAVPSIPSAGDLRIYAGGKVTFAVNNGKILSMSFAISKQGLQRFAEITPSTGNVVSQGANPLVWEGSDSSVTFTVGALAKYGSQSSKAGQFCFDKVTIVTTDGATPGGELPVDEPVIDPNVPVSGSLATFDWTNPAGLSPSMSSPTSGNGVIVLGTKFENNGIELQINKGESTSDSKLWLDNVDGIQLRVYKGSTMSFTSLSNRDIKEIRFFGPQASSDFLLDGGKGEFVDVDGQAVWTAGKGVTNVTFNVTYQFRTTSIVVKYGSAGVILGDVNADGEITISDIVELCNAILGNPSVNYVADAADIDGDGAISIADVVVLVNSVMVNE